MKSLDLRRKRFGRLVAIRKTQDKEKSIWECICDCGKIVKVFRENLIRGSSQSCGCLRSEEQHKQFWKGCGEISGVYWYDLNRSAKYRLIEFSITIEDAWELFLKQDKKCYFTDEVLIFTSNRKKDAQKQTASLDRLDNNKGYILDNVCWVHKRINALKSNFTVDELLYWCKKIVEYDKRTNHI